MSDIIKAIIIDDEETYISSLEIMLEKNFTNINIIGKANSVLEAQELINSLEVDLLFLDINLTDGTGFDLLKSIKNKNFEVIFITSHTEYAIQAFEFAAMHYILKPISLNNLAIAIDRFFKVRQKENYKEKLDVMLKVMSKKSENILIPTLDGLKLYPLSTIVRIEADNCYTNIYLSNKQKLVVSKTLQKFEIALNDYNFVRIHSKHLINLDYFASVKIGTNASLILKDATELPISRAQKNNLLEKLKYFANTI